MKKGALYLIPIPIAEGAENTLSQQVPDRIRHLDYFLVENVRTARRFISSLNLGLTIEELQFEVLDKHTPDARLSQLLQPILNGKDAGVLSESGCPGIADPGSRIVHLAHEKNISVQPLVGPSSLILALMASGFNGQQFAFHGYLPIKKPELRKKLLELESESSQKNQSQLFIEAPYRNNQLLESMCSTCNHKTYLCVASDIQGPDELIKTQPIAKWAGDKPDLHKKPTVFILYAGR